MLTEICQYLKNWFDRRTDGSNYAKFYGGFTIADGEIRLSGGEAVPMTDGQYFRIIGSLLNDGVYQHPAVGLRDEVFDGEVWSMAVPPEVVSLAGDIEKWQEKYGGVDSAAMSPYSSESFGGYSYSKAQGYASAGGGMLTSWQNVFANRLAPWRKI